MKIVEQIEAVAEEICNDYCKWPETYEIYEKDDENMDRMHEEICNNCPLNKLI